MIEVLLWWMGQRAKSVLYPVQAPLLRPSLDPELVLDLLNSGDFLLVGSPNLNQLVRMHQVWSFHVC
jgi:hypothetical protein